MTKQTKYYFIDFAIEPDLSEINPEEITKFVKDGKATENWIFMQIDGSIKVAFGKYGMSYPKYVFINRDYKRKHEMVLTIVRDNFKDEKEAMFWNTQRIFVQEELNHQAWANSDEEGLTYNFTKKCLREATESFSSVEELRLI